jgi:hypothetical protein
VEGPSQDQRLAVPETELRLEDRMNKELDPDAKEAAEGVKRALMELQIYASSHTIDPRLSKSVEALVVAGALSPKTADFIANHHTRFYGFEPSRTGLDFPVLDVVLVGRATPLRFVGFAGGHVQRVALEKILTPYEA